jgi:phosphoserine phosphatase
MDRNLELCRSDENSIFSETESFCEDKQDEVSDSDDDLPLLYLVAKRKRLADIAANKSDLPDQKIAKANDFDKKFQTFLGGHTNSYFDQVFQSLGDAEKKDRSIARVMHDEILLSCGTENVSENKQDEVAEVSDSDDDLPFLYHRNSSN